MRWQCRQYYEHGDASRLFCSDTDQVPSAMIQGMCDDCKARVGSKYIMMSHMAHTAGIVDRMISFEW